VYVVINPLAAENCKSALYALLSLLLTVSCSSHPVPSNPLTSQTPHAEPSTNLHAAKFSLPANCQQSTFLLPIHAARCHLRSHAEHHLRPRW
jgi:hypothetical protein